jgi:hypothetical protein
MKKNIKTICSRVNKFMKFVKKLPVHFFLFWTIWIYMKYRVNKNRRRRPLVCKYQSNSHDKNLLKKKTKNANRNLCSDNFTNTLAGQKYFPTTYFHNVLMKSFLSRFSWIFTFNSIDANPFVAQSVTKIWDVSNLWCFSVIIIFHKILP